MRLLSKPIRSYCDFVRSRASENTERQIDLITLGGPRGEMAERPKLFSETARRRVMKMNPEIASLVVMHLHISIRLT